MREYRKRALSNLALAKDLKLSKKELIQIAKGSFQNLAINCLEYPRLSREKDFSRVISCENPEVAQDLGKRHYFLLRPSIELGSAIFRWDDKNAGNCHRQVHQK